MGYLPPEPEGPGDHCVFNGVAFQIGEYVLSGSEQLRCEAPGDVGARG